MEVFPTYSAHHLSTPELVKQRMRFITRFKQIFTKNSPQTNAAANGHAAGKGFHLSVAQRTDVGRQRTHNEDNVAYIIPKNPTILAKKGALFIVADGMGGHAAGEVASEMAVSTISTLYYQDEVNDAPTCLFHAIKYANAAIYQRAIENTEHNGMGTTCVAAVLLGTTAYIANVGDSRAYLVHRGRLRQVSQDHSWVAEQVRAGGMTEEEARTHDMRNMITRSLGPQPDIEVDLFVEEVEHGDALVLCSDGLHGMITDTEILWLVEQFSPHESVQRLIARANAQGGLDNVTAIIARIFFERKHH